MLKIQRPFHERAQLPEEKCQSNIRAEEMGVERGLGGERQNWLNQVLWISGFQSQSLLLQVRMSMVLKPLPGSSQLRVTQDR